MPLSTRRALTLGCFAAAALAWSGCEAKKQTEYVAGISTQVQVPRDLKSIRIDVSVGGVVLFCRGYRVYDGKVQLPRSLGEIPSQDKPGPDPITVTVSGFTEEFSETSGNSVFENCTAVAPKVGDPSQGTRILRRSRQPYVLDTVLFLPMPLKYSCFDKDCPREDQTCKGGVCVDAKIDETKLPKYADDLVDGAGGGCFRAGDCFSASVPAVVVDPTDCTFALPNTPSSPELASGAPPNPLVSAGEGINVEVSYDGGYNREILDKDPEEGFTIPDASKPQRFRLSAGLCELFKGEDASGNPTAHRITAVRATGVCQAKGPFQPLCASDQLIRMGLDAAGISPNAGAPTACTAKELKPAQSALVVLADDTDNSRSFFEGIDEKVALSLSLSDPAFRKTDIGMTYFPGRPDQCAGFENKVPMTSALAARDLIFAAFNEKVGSLNSSTEDVGMGAAIADVAAKLTAAYPNANRRAILIVGNRGFDDASTTCSPKPAAAAAAAKALGVETYVTLLARDPDVAGSTAGAPLPLDVPSANDVAAAGSPSTAATPLAAYDARAAANKGRAQEAFRQVVEDLATCAYDVPGALGDGDELSYSDPIGLQNTLYVVKPAAPGTCTSAAGTGDGWGVDATTPTRIRICGQSCTTYREVLKRAAAWGLSYRQPALAVPVFSHKKGCAPAP